MKLSLLSIVLATAVAAQSNLETFPSVVGTNTPQDGPGTLPLTFTPLSSTPTTPSLSFISPAQPTSPPANASLSLSQTSTPASTPTTPTTTFQLPTGNTASPTPFNTGQSLTPNSAGSAVLVAFAALLAL